MFYVLSKTADILLSPLVWGLLLSLAAIFAKRVKTQRLLVGSGISILLLFSTPIVANRLWRFIEPAPPRTLAADARFDAAILLGGIVSHNPTATIGATCYNDSAERLLTTYDLLRTNRVRDAIITGGKASEADTIVEADEIGKQLASWGIERKRLVLEDRARNTRENAVETARIVRERGYKSLLLVTSAFHMERSLQTFNEVGVDVTPYPVDYRSFDPNVVAASEWLPRADHLADSEKALRELFGRLVYRIVGYGRK